ncbi:MAG: tryptophan--tRNA ligase, partial [Candidatus Yanofskybacteria bacterium CG10_big_fil_rev_8_21_14_0_10_46_23]
MKVFSGIRSSGRLHLGNYLGAIKNWIELQDQAEQSIFAVVDYHGITTPFDPKSYKQQVLDTVLDFLAAGVNPNPPAGGPLLIRQSQIPQHTELAWIFNTITPLGWLDRLPTYKEKQAQATSHWQNNVGILTYPTLMAADILVYKTDSVPVGDDQKAHIDITNEIAKKFNSLFGETFPAVKILKSQGERIRSLKNPESKMSKTGDEGIALSDSPEEIILKIKSAITDSESVIRFDSEEKPAISNLLTIYHLLSGKDIADLEKEYAEKNYVDFKSDL